MFKYEAKLLKVLILIHPGHSYPKSDLCVDWTHAGLKLQQQQPQRWVPELP